MFQILRAFSSAFSRSFQVCGRRVGKKINSEVLRGQVGEVALSVCGRGNCPNFVGEGWGMVPSGLSFFKMSIWAVRRFLSFKKGEPTSVVPLFPSARALVLFLFMNN